ncbi:hypothetical protein MTX78_15010 [Hymenobacter tibetensis]|uniref:Uncharacterized protein n=1 Tax=Hymenobacter tibetensis TaxID=497967 RepID=A0ABY4D0G9_9BACT|nr:hypothetical protein [Hymenobacter tibetensis]UOG73433.1 hypothetical protein MTX78_15010 [Hymenobacter tibetensis]
MKNDTKGVAAAIGLTLLNLIPFAGLFLYLKQGTPSPDDTRRILVSTLVDIPARLAMGYLLNTYICN